MQKKILLFIFLLMYSLGSDAMFGLKQREIAYITGYGFAISRNNIPEGNYQPYYFIGHFGLDLTCFVKNTFFKKVILTTYSEPQVNYVRIMNWENSSMHEEYEFGINSGFKFMYPICKNLYLSFQGGSGPHFITAYTIRQYRGFLFSDAFGYGINYFLHQKLSISAMFRLRHMSNLNIFVPNSGINTYNIHVGVHWWIF